MRHNAPQFPGQAYETVSREAISYIYIFYLEMRHNFCLSNDAMTLADKLVKFCSKLENKVFQSQVK